MNVPQLKMEKERAQELYEQYRDALQGKKDKVIADLKVVYSHMRHGRAVIDIFQAAKEAGLNEHFDPRIAIVRADYRQCRFKKFGDNIGIFMGRSWSNGRGPHAAANEDVVIPAGTWSPWPRPNPARLWEIPRADLTTITPAIPPAYIPDGALSNYYLLWEPEEWTDETPKNPPRDPMLLKRVSPNIFVVLASWDLTEVERAVIRGRIA